MVAVRSSIIFALGLSIALMIPIAIAAFESAPCVDEGTVLGPPEDRPEDRREGTDVYGQVRLDELSGEAPVMTREQAIEAARGGCLHGAMPRTNPSAFELLIE